MISAAAHTIVRKRFDRDSLLGGIFILATLVAIAGSFARDLRTVTGIATLVAVGCLALSRDRLNDIGAAFAFLSLRLLFTAAVTRTRMALALFVAAAAVTFILFRIAVARASR